MQDVFVFLKQQLLSICQLALTLVKYLHIIACLTVPPQQKTDILFIFSAVPAEHGSADFLRADRLYSSIQCRLP